MKKMLAKNLTERGFPRYVKVGQAICDLRAGRLAGRVGPLPAGSRYEIKYPNGVVGVRGGLYLITSSGMVEAATGEVVVAWVGADGAAVTKLVTAGNRLNAGAGSVTAIPASPTSNSPAPKTQPTSEPAPATNSPVKPPTRGPGLGGSLRKF